MPGDPAPPVHLRLGDLFNAIEDWRRAQPKIPARTDAIKELVRRGLKAEQRASNSDRFGSGSVVVTSVAAEVGRGKATTEAGDS
jgi:hypothetical protein